MLHNSPNGAGIAWEKDNVYWVADGYHGSLTRYDFQSDHGPGGSDHTDGIVTRYVEGQFSYVSGVPSHMELDRESGTLYVADTGNNRIALLDISTGTRGATIHPNYDGSEQYYMDGALLETWIDGEANGLVQPSGLALADDRIYVTDNATARITAFDMDGVRLDYLDLGSMMGEHALMGIEVAPDGSLYVVDAADDRVIHLEALAP
jgi:sugar lactone lactonase YvrE